jgi:hypothetical protein
LRQFSIQVAAYGLVDLHGLAPFRGNRAQPGTPSIARTPDRDISMVFSRRLTMRMHNAVDISSGVSLTAKLERQ